MLRRGGWSLLLVFLVLPGCCGTHLDPNGCEAEAHPRRVPQRGGDRAGAAGERGDRIEKIRPPANVAAQHARLVAQLRDYARVVDEVVADAKRDGLDEQAWDSDRRVLQPKITSATSAIFGTIQSFKARGYSIFTPPTD